MNPEIVYRLRTELADHLPSLNRWQVSGLAVACAALSLEKHCSLSRMAEAVPELGSVNTVRQRLKRWVQNPGIRVEAVCEDWIRWVWSRWGMSRALLLVDETKLNDRIGVMMVSLAYGGRAIPLVWRCYEADQADAYPAQGQVLLVYGLLARVLAVLPVKARPLVQMDRGLAHSAAMLRTLETLGVDYLVRIKATARFTPTRQPSYVLREQLTPGIQRTQAGRLFTRHHQVSGHLHLLWEPGQSEAWCLFSNAPELSAARYALRWWQEESFRDLKSGGWQWEASRLRCPARMERLLLILAVTYAWMLALGVHAFHQPDFLPRADQGRYSFFRLGLRYLRSLLLTAPHCIHMAYPFAPPWLSSSA